MIGALDIRPSARALLALVLAGGCALLAASVAGGLLPADGSAPAPLLAALQAAAAVGYSSFSFGACVSLARRAAPNRLLVQANIAFALLVPAAGLCDLAAAVMLAVTATGASAAPAAEAFRFMLTRTRFVALVAFLWMAALSCYLALKRLRKK
jgi:hypothetical protein